MIRKKKDKKGKKKEKTAKKMNKGVKENIIMASYKVDDHILNYLFIPVSSTKRQQDF